MADIFRIDQRSKLRRLAIAVPLFAVGIGITFVDFDVVWRYFSWTNQALATVVLWCIVVYLNLGRRNVWVALLPAVFMTFVCSSFVFVSPQFFGMGATTPAYIGGAVATAVLTAAMCIRLRRDRLKNRI